MFDPFAVDGDTGGAGVEAVGEPDGDEVLASGFLGVNAVVLPVPDVDVTLVLLPDFVTERSFEDFPPMTPPAPCAMGSASPRPRWFAL